MKQTIFTAILIFTSCFADFAQTNENLCRKINISAPEFIQMEETFKVFASFEKENQPSMSKFNWTIIMGNEVSKLNNEGIIEIDSKKLKDSETIIVLADSLDEKCQNVAMAKISVVPRCGLVYTIDEYGKSDWDEERAHLDNVAFQMQNFKDTELFTFFDFDKTTSLLATKNHLMKVLNYLSTTGKLEKNRVTFLISESDKEKTRFQPFQKDSNFYACDNCLIIRGEDLEKLENLFQPKPITKNRKK